MNDIERIDINARGIDRPIDITPYNIKEFFDLIFKIY